MGCPSTYSFSATALGEKVREGQVHGLDLLLTEDPSRGFLDPSALDFPRLKALCV